MKRKTIVGLIESNIKNRDKCQKGVIKSSEPFFSNDNSLFYLYNFFSLLLMQPTKENTGINVVYLHSPCEMLVVISFHILFRDGSGREKKH